MLATEWELKNIKGIIYLIKNKINCKKYVGQTNNTFIERYSYTWYNHHSINPHLRYAIQKYGPHNFEIEILLKDQTEDALNYWEIFYIDYFQTLNRKYGYNKKSGGENSKPSYETIEKQAKSLLHLESFLIKAKSIHGNKYDYSKVKMLPFKEYEEIYCKKCNEYFIQKRKSHLAGRGCKKCGINQSRRTLGLEEFIRRANIKYNQSFEYNSKGYIDCRSKIEMLHKSCGTVFFQSMKKHLEDKISCPKCSITYRKIRIYQ